MTCFGSEKGRVAVLQRTLRASVPTGLGNTNQKPMFYNGRSDRASLQRATRQPKAKG